MRISDWSSDVCSSDLIHQCAALLVSGPVQGVEPFGAQPAGFFQHRDRKVRVDLDRQLFHGLIEAKPLGPKETVILNGRHIVEHRSEERRVGKECVSTFRSWWSRDI